MNPVPSESEVPEAHPVADPVPCDHEWIDGGMVGSPPVCSKCRAVPTIGIDHGITVPRSSLHLARLKAERLRFKRRKEIFQGTFTRAVLGHITHPLHLEAVRILAAEEIKAKKSKKKLKLEVAYPIARRKARNILKRKRQGRVK